MMGKAATDRRGMNNDGLQIINAYICGLTGYR
jgi:hypothetical protein